MKYELRRVNTNGFKGANPLRTEQIIGIYEKAPEVGQPFIFLGKSLDFAGGVRAIMTSPVAELTPTGFKTANSTYELVPYVSA